MTETKRIGIGYTIFEFDGKKKKPLVMVKSTPGNFMAELRRLEDRMKRGRINMFWLCLGGFAYGYTVRVVLAL